MEAYRSRLLVTSAMQGDLELNLQYESTTHGAAGIGIWYWCAGLGDIQHPASAGEHKEGRAQSPCRPPPHPPPPATHTHMASQNAAPQCRTWVNSCAKAPAGQSGSSAPRPPGPARDAPHAAPHPPRIRHERFYPHQMCQQNSVSRLTASPLASPAPISTTEVDRLRRRGRNKGAYVSTFP